MDRLRIDGGRVTFEGSLISPYGSSIEVRIKGPTLRHIGLSGSGNVDVTGISQSELGVDIRGSGSVRGRGAVQKLELNIFGSGNAELADLLSEDVDVSIYGSGGADVSASGTAAVKIVGSGDVRLSSTPRSLSTEVIGSGRVVQPHASGIATDD